jgi:hypothetical protein
VNIGLDLDDQRSRAAVLNAAGEVIEGREQR